METCGVFLWHFNLLCDNGSGLAFQGIDGIFQICDDCRASSSGCDKINGSTDLWKHGIYTELIGCDMFFCLDRFQRTDGGNCIAVIDIRNGRVGKTAIFSQPVF